MTAASPVPPRGLRALVALARAGLHLAAGPEHVLRVVVDEVTAALGADCTCWLYESGEDARPAALTGNHEPAFQRAAAEAYAGTESATLLLAGTPDGAWLSGYGVAQCALAPMRYGSRRLGALAVTRDAGRPAFTAGELDLVAALADVAGAVAQQARMLADSLAAFEEVRQLVEVVDHISDALVSCDAGYQIVSWNTGAEQVYGYAHSEALGCDLFALLATEFATADGSEVDRDEVLCQLALDGRWQGELRQRRADGAPLIVMASLTALAGADGQLAGLVAVNRDVTEQRHDEHRAMHDALTGLANRRLLDVTLYEAFARACRTHRTLAVLFIDLDGFKPINDTYGHACGDVVLTATAQRLVAVLRDRDTVARLGGDEFVVILEEAGNTGAVESVTRRVADALAVPIELDPDTVVSVKASIGVAVLEEPDGESSGGAHALLEAADQAMYTAKRRRTGIAFAP